MTDTSLNMFKSQNIQVFVRCRPLNPSEKRSVIEAVPSKREIKVLERNSSSSTYDTKSFHFDQVFSPDARQKDVYNKVVEPLINQVLLGYNCTVFAYGQTGTGKTFTMEGDHSDGKLSWEDDSNSGIIPRAISQLFESLSEHDRGSAVRVSFLELYNEDAYDLLSSLDDTTRLKIFDDAQKKGSVIVGGLEEIVVKTKEEIYEVLKKGSAKRQTAATLLNACSSRSHTIFSVTVHVRESSIEGEELLKVGKLNLVDLAGSENIGRSGAQDKRAREAGNINQSLLTLGRVITALVEKRPHIPYRESKLTRLLQDSLGGKTKTSIIATISPAPLDLEDTLSTLDYASRAKKITNKPEMNKRITSKQRLRECEFELERLRKELKITQEKNGYHIDEATYLDMQEKEERLIALQGELEKSRKLYEDFSSHHEETKAELERTKKSFEELVHVSIDVTNDIALLHDKQERLEKVYLENLTSIESCRKELKEEVSKHQRLYEVHSSDQVSGFDSMIDTVSQQIESNKLQEQEVRIDSAKYKESLDKLKAEYNEQVKLAEDLERRSMAYRAKANDLIKQILEINLNREPEYENHLKVINRLDGALSDIKETLFMFRDHSQKNSSTFISTMRREYRSFIERLERFFTREMKECKKTGVTPLKKTYNIPKGERFRVDLNGRPHLA